MHDWAQSLRMHGATYQHVVPSSASTSSATVLQYTASAEATSYAAVCVLLTIHQSLHPLAASQTLTQPSLSSFSLSSLGSYPTRFQLADRFLLASAMRSVCSSLLLVLICALLGNEGLLTSAQPTVGCGAKFTIDLAEESSVDFQSMSRGPLGIWGLSQGPIQPNISTAVINLCATSSSMCATFGASSTKACVIYGSTGVALCNGDFTFALINSTAPRLGATFSFPQASAPPLVGLVSSVPVLNHAASDALTRAVAHLFVAPCAYNFPIRCGPSAALVGFDALYTSGTITGVSPQPMAVSPSGAIQNVATFDFGVPLAKFCTL